MNKIDIDSLDNDELLKLYSSVIKNLKKRNLIRSGNIKGDLGEDMVVRIYNNTPNLPKLQLAPEGTKNVDAISRNGERYTIKTITYPNKTTGVFYHLNPPDSSEHEEKKFEYLVVVSIDDDCQPVEILEATWETFLKYKKWHKTMKAWNISLTESFKESCRVILQKKVNKIVISNKV